MDSSRESIKSPLIARDILTKAYQASTSTIYGGYSDDRVDDVDETPPKRRRHITLLDSPDAQKLRRELKYFFMNPVQKWRFRRRFPWKLLGQVIKIIIVTSQVILFCQESSYHHNYHEDSRTTFAHLFLKGWVTNDEVLSYPPAGGPMAVYRRSEFFNYLDYAIGNFANIEKVSTTTYKHKLTTNGIPVPASLCVKQYSSNETLMQNGTMVTINGTIITKCIHIPPSDAKHINWTLETYLEAKNESINFELISEVRLHFILHAFRLKVELPDRFPNCHTLNGTVMMHKTGGSRMLVTLDLQMEFLKCHRTLNVVHPKRTTKVWWETLDVLSLVVCIFSTALCIRSLHRAKHLKEKTSTFFSENIGRTLTSKENWEFLNMWYVLIIIDDIVLVAGLSLKLYMEIKGHRVVAYAWSLCAICLGVGNYMAWVGVLRYLGFFATYNVMILTMKKCIPNVLRLSFNILLIFFGYTFAGWLILGPYHIKFKTFMSSMECLFSLINGDDMFASFFSTSGLDPLIWYFSRVYLYSFISLFMWVILSIFIAVIMDAYETIKTYYEEGFPRTGLMKFVSECSYRDLNRETEDRERTLHDTFNAICCCIYE